MPTLVHEGATIFESAAIVLYLTDAYARKDIGPRIGEPERGAYLSWLAYYGDVLESAFISKILNTPQPGGSAGWVPAEEAIDLIVRILSAATFILGDKFSAADM